MNKKYNCKVCELCGGCQLAHLSYEKQLESKQQRINDLLGAFCKVDPIVGMDDPFNYRNKVNASFGKQGNRIVYGNYVASTHEIVEADNCLLCDELANAIIKTIHKLVIKYHISIFDEHSYKGCLRHVMVRASKLNEYMVVLVTGSFRIYNGDQLVKELVKIHPEIRTIVQSINSAHTSMVLGEKMNVLYGKGYIHDELCGLIFKLSAASFFQVNKTQTEKLYDLALEYADFKGRETVIDAYCGIGTISLAAAKKAGKVLGVEINRQAIRDAQVNMKLNDIENVEFVADDAGRYMARLAKQKIRIDTVIMDPPRSGADKKFMDSVIYLRPKKIVYVSCGPASLKQNLQYFSKYYRVEKIRPVDMFPYTEHVETVVLMAKKDLK